MSDFWDDVWGTLFDTNGPAQKAAKDFAKKHDLPDPVGPESGVITDITDTVSFAKLVWLNVSDFRMWRSLGWLILGIVMMIIGFVIWTRKALPGIGGLAAL